MRFFTFVLVVTLAMFLGTAPAKKGDWAAVEGISAGTAIQVKTKQGKKWKGELETADPGRLVILAFERHFPGRIMVRRELKRDDVKEVRLVHPYVSSAAGAAIGAGVGAGIGAAVESQYSSNEDKRVATVVFGFLGAGVGSVVGRTTAFIRSKPIYIAP